MVVSSYAPLKLMTILPMLQRICRDFYKNNTENDKKISRRKFAGNFDFLLDKSIDVQKEKEKIEVADHSNDIPGLYST